MNRIALRYESIKLDNLVFDEMAANQKTFKTVKTTYPVVNTAEEAGVLLNGRRYSHRLYSHRELEVIISADEITDSIRTFLEEFWLSSFKYISLNEASVWNTSVWSDYRQVITTGGKFPLTYVEDIKFLPEVSFSFIYANPE